MTLVVLADENIASLDDYFLSSNIKLIKTSGREINQKALDFYQPNALLIRSVTPINANTIKQWHKLKFIGSATIGIDHIDEAFLKNNHIAFANAKGSSKHSVAQYVITALLTKFPELINKKITIGIIGLGNIGTTLAKYAKDLNWEILGYDPYLPTSDLNNSDFEHLLKTSDIISIHTPLTKTDQYPTYQLFNEHIFNHLKDNAILINTARGEIINQEDLLTAIDNKNLQVILDVFPFEPIIDKILLDKLQIATPHIAGYTTDGKLRGTDMIYQAFCQFFDLPITQTMKNILPPNEFYWHKLRSELLNDNNKILISYYDILRDNEQLRQIYTDKVQGKDFDKLRKYYKLKREWHY